MEYHGTLDINPTIEWGEFEIAGKAGGIGTLNNQGTINKGGLSNSSAKTTAYFNNSGTVNIDTGTFIVGKGGNHSGDFIGDPNTRLEFGISGSPAGTINLNAGSTVIAPRIHFESGTTNIYGSYEAFGTSTVTAVYGGASIGEQIRDRLSAEGRACQKQSHTHAERPPKAGASFEASKIKHFLSPGQISVPTRARHDAGAATARYCTSRPVRIPMPCGGVKIGFVLGLNWVRLGSF